MVLLVPTDAFQGAGMLNLAATAIAAVLIALEFSRKEALA